MRKISLFATVLLLHALLALSQTHTITGQVKDAKGVPISFASIKVKGARGGVAADANGNFTLSIPQNATLIITASGFEPLQLPTGSDAVLYITLTLAEGSLSEVVVTAMGIRRSKNTLPYAAQQVLGDEVSRTRNDNFMDGLSGKVAGLQVTQNNALGSSTNVIIRGFKSLTGNNQALFVVDGTPVDNSNNNTAYQTAGGGGFDYGNSAADINPDDIESINVLKGAAATALYGSRAANGVILITTKKGRKGLGITINSGVSYGEIDKSTFAKYQHEYGAGYGNYYQYGSPDGNFFYFDVNGDGVPDLVTPTTEDASWGPKFDPNLKVYQWDAFDNTSPNYHKATPWVAAKNDPTTYFEKPVSLSNSLLIDGGDDKLSFKLGYTRNNDKGILPNSQINKDMLNFGSTYKISDQLTVGAAVNFSQVRGLGRYGTGYDPKNPMNSFRQWWEMNNDVKELKDAYFRTRQNDTWNWKDPTTTAGLIPIFWNNTYWDRYENYENDSRSRIFGNVNLNYKITDWLSATGRVSLDSYSELHEERNAIGSVPSFLAGDISPRTSPASGYSRFNRDFSEYNWDGLLNFDKNVTRHLNIKALAGGNIRQTHISSILAVTNGGLVVPKLYSLSNSVSPIAAPVESETQIQVNGVFAGTTLTWKDMLILDATIRRDHSSTLPNNNSSYNYPSISGGFVFSKLINNLPWLSYGKLRANYAEVGNSAPALSLSDVYDKPTPFGTATLFAVPKTKNNANLRPEKTKSYEVGAEINFLANRIGLDATYYNSKSIDQILPVAVSTATGYDYEYVNAGVIQNRGVELALNLVPVKTKNFEWDMNINWNKNISKVLSLFGPDSSSVLQLNPYPLQGGVSINAVPGQPYGQIRGQNFVYYSYKDGAGNTVKTNERIVKANGYYQISAGSNEVIGNAYPDWTGGVSNTFRYKKLSLSFLIDVRQGGNVFSLDQYYGLATGLYPETAGLNDLGNPVRNTVANGGGIIFKGVTTDGKTNTTRVDGTVNGANYFGLFGYIRNPAAAFVYDASYVKLREATITYSLPKEAIEKLHYLKGIDIGLFGRNLWIIHKNLPYADPEDLLSSGNIQGYQSGAYPTTRTIGVNVKLKF